MINYNWPGKYKPYGHQRETAQFLVENKRAYCFDEAGCGKTASVIWAADYLMLVGEVKKVLVVCPLSIINSAWQADIFRVAMHRSCGVCYGTPLNRRKILEMGLDFTVINFDGVKTVYNEIKAANPDLIIIDEVNAYKNYSTDRHKLMRTLSKSTARIWAMTGTPAAQSPLDAYGLAKLITPDTAPKYFGSFRDSVMLQVSRFKWVPKHNAAEVVHSLLQPAIRHEKKDCVDLPPVTHTMREAPMTAQQTKYYKALKKEMYIAADGKEVTAVNAASKINKLLQVAGGAVYSDNEDTVFLDASNRLSIMMEVIEEASHKVLVFVPYVHLIDLVYDYITSKGVKAEKIFGAVRLKDRSSIVTDFQTTEATRVLIMQPKTTAHGLTLTQADTIIWYLPITSVETYLQANDRINRLGQTNPMNVVRLIGSPIEVHTYGMLDEDIDVHASIIDLYNKEMMYD